MSSAIPYLLNIQYARLLQKIDVIFRENAKNLLSHPCKRGCFACCVGPFDINHPELWLLIEALSFLNTKKRQKVLLKIRKAAKVQRNLLGIMQNDPISLESIGEDHFDDMCDKLEKQPCPFLSEENDCFVYNYRPELCRLHGFDYLTSDGLIPVGCPEGWIDHFEPIRAELQDIFENMRRLELNCTIAGLEGNRTSLALGLDFILRR